MRYLLPQVSTTRRSHTRSRSSLPLSPACKKGQSARDLEVLSQMCQRVWPSAHAKLCSFAGFCLHEERKVGDDGCAERDYSLWKARG